MMQPSAFDEALEQPFLSERTQKKKWSILSSVSSQSTVTMKTMLDESDYDDLEDPFAGLVAANETVQLIPTETIIFGDDALAQERHGELLGINASLKQINTIHQDLAGLVQVQDDDIKRMSWFAIESFENTESGLEQIVRAAKFSDQYQFSQRRKTLLMIIMGVAAVLGLSRAALINNTDQQRQDGNMIQTPNTASGSNDVHTPMIYIPNASRDGPIQP